MGPVRHKDQSEPGEGHNDHPTIRAAGTLERHVQTILISIITGAIIFAANYFYNDNRGKAVQGAQLEMLTNQVIEMRSDLRALQTNYVKREELREIEIRIRDIERKVMK